jgi:hypothetical protein
MRLNKIVPLLVLSLLASALPNANAIVTPGLKCSKVGSKQTYKGKVYTCIKSGKKLIWNSGIVVKAKPLPTPTSTPTVFSNSSIGIVSDLAGTDEVFRVNFTFSKLSNSLRELNYDIGIAYLKDSSLPQDLISSYSYIYFYKNIGTATEFSISPVELQNHLISIGINPTDKSVMFFVRGAQEPFFGSYGNGIYLTPEQVNRKNGSNPTPTPTPKPTPTPTQIIDSPGRAPFFYITYVTSAPHLLQVVVPASEIELYEYNGFSADSYIARAVYDGNKEIRRGILERNKYSLNDNMIFQFSNLTGDIVEFNIAPINNGSIGKWSVSHWFSLKELKELSLPNPYPIDGVYKLGEIGPGGGRIYLTPNSSTEHLKGYSAVAPITPVGFYYEIAPPKRTFLGFPQTCWPGIDDRLKSIKNVLTRNDGAANTQKIIDSGLCASNSIFHLASELNINGVEDWFIPSEEELIPFASIFTGRSKHLWETFVISRSAHADCYVSFLNINNELFGVRYNGYTTPPFPYGSPEICAVRKFKK